MLDYREEVFFTKQLVNIESIVNKVGIDDFTHLQSQAYTPDDLMKALKHEVLPSNIQEHLQSDDWLFGRGVLDMKNGVASHLYLLRYYSEHPEELEKNGLLLLFCCNIKSY